MTTGRVINKDEVLGVSRACMCDPDTRLSSPKVSAKESTTKKVRGERYTGVKNVKGVGGWAKRIQQKRDSKDQDINSKDISRW